MISTKYSTRRHYFVVACYLDSQGLCSGTIGKADLLFKCITIAHLIFAVLEFC